MDKPKLTFLDKRGWPVVFIKGRPITNITRFLLHVRRIGRFEFTPERTGCGGPTRGPVRPAEEEG